ncbi:MAG: PD40 domain-containing protein [Armatimonadetes bacterium]|nr:PD40 domain-containing protein [Anaerolineae bacterium]
MSAARNEQLLKQATEAARDGDRIEAARLIDEVLLTDARNVKALTLLYRISDDLDEKRAALEAILEADPLNVRAKEALEKLETRVGKRGTGADEDEVAPGISRRQLLTIIGGLVGLVVLVLAIVGLTISANNRANTDRFATETSIANFTTAIALGETSTVEIGTQSAIAAVTDFFATNSATPIPTSTRRGATLPPEFTATNTPPPATTPTALPPPPEARGIIIGVGSTDLINDGYYDLITVNANSSEAPRVISNGVDERGRYATAGSSERIVYTRYDRSALAYTLVTVNASDGASDFLSNRWANSAQGSLLDADMAHILSDGSKLVFTARGSDALQQVYLLDFNAGGDPLTKLTADGLTYEFPALAPDGRQVIVVRTDPSVTPPTVDLFQLTIGSTDLRPITADAGAIIETQPRYSPDGREIAYAARPGDGSTRNHDVYVRAADGSGDALNVSNDAGDDISPVYSPDFRYIAFASNRTGSYQIYVFDRNTGSLYQVTNGSAARESYFPGAWVEN